MYMYMGLHDERGGERERERGGGRRKEIKRRGKCSDIQLSIITNTF